MRVDISSRTLNLNRENNSLSDIAQAQSEGKTMEKKEGEYFEAENERYKIFFFQAEDGIRDIGVTGVHTCALPIYVAHDGLGPELPLPLDRRDPDLDVE